MNDTFILKQPLSSDTESLLLKISHTCTESGIAFFIAGATAREVMLTHVHGRKSGRQTRDIDIAVFIDNWDQFSRIKQTMVAQGARALTNNAHRLIWDDMELDIIPFGDIAEKNQIAWPPDREFIMNVDGFPEAFEHANQVQIIPDNAIRFCSIPGLLLLKLLAWRDRGNRGTKDAVDIFNILTEYHRIEEERIYDNDEWGEHLDWNVERLGPLLAGSDTAAIASAETRQELLALDKLRLTDAIVGQNPTIDARNIEDIIDDFWDGLAGTYL